eukprot:PhF_6_TR36080/c0_g1_i1/m.52419
MKRNREEDDTEPTVSSLALELKVAQSTIQQLSKESQLMQASPEPYDFKNATKLLVGLQNLIVSREQNEEGNDELQEILVSQELLEVLLDFLGAKNSLIRSAAAVTFNICIMLTASEDGCVIVGPSILERLLASVFTYVEGVDKEEFVTKLIELVQTTFENAQSQGVPLTLLFPDISLLQKATVFLLQLLSSKLVAVVQTASDCLFQITFSVQHHEDDSGAVIGELTKVFPSESFEKLLTAIARIQSTKCCYANPPLNPDDPLCVDNVDIVGNMFDTLCLLLSDVSGVYAERFVTTCEGVELCELLLCKKLPHTESYIQSQVLRVVRQLMLVTAGSTKSLVSASLQKNKIVSLLLQKMKFDKLRFEEKTRLVDVASHACAVGIFAEDVTIPDLSRAGVILWLFEVVQKVVDGSTRQTLLLHAKTVLNKGWTTMMSSMEKDIERNLWSRCHKSLAPGYKGMLDDSEDNFLK